MKNDIKNINGTFKDKLSRSKIGDDPKRRIVINAKVLYAMLNQPSISFEDWCKHIEKSPLRLNIDYQYTQTKDTMLLSISAMQAILVMTNSMQSWELHHEMTDLIHNGFASKN